MWKNILLLTLCVATCFDVSSAMVQEDAFGTRIVTYDSIEEALKHINDN